MANQEENLRPSNASATCLHLLYAMTSNERHSEASVPDVSQAGPLDAREFLNLAHDAMIVRDMQKHIAFWNRGAERLYGWRQDEVLGKSVHELLQTKFPRPLEELREELLDTGRWEGILVHTAKDGRRITVESRWSVARGRTHAVLEINRDISNYQSVVEMLARERVARTEAESRHSESERIHKEREFFIGALGHDLRNPLNAIGMAAALLLRRGDGSAEAMKAGNRILSNVDTMTRMVGQLLDFARARHGNGIPIERAAMSLHDVCREVIANAEVHGHAHRIRLETAGSGLGLWDHDRLMQVVDNLLFNALQHGAADQPVRVWVGPAGADRLRLTIHNHGNVIPPELLPRIFDPFRTLQHRRGLGLGLYIAEQIVKGHGGTIDVRSSADGGTTFTVELPGALP
jgi:PAS domain S-box-containing protein